MRTVLIVLTVLLLSACPDKESDNRAIAFISFAEPSADCHALDTGVKGLADTAVCRIKGQLLYCAGMEGAKPICEPYIDPRPATPASSPPQGPRGPAETPPPSPPPTGPTPPMGPPQGPGPGR